MKHYKRLFESVVVSRLKEKPRLIQTIMGPRQVGKTTGILNALKSNFTKNEYEYFSCEEGLHDREWFLQQVQNSILNKKKILVFDEIQKLEGWSDLVKLVWDKNKRSARPYHLVLLGSSSLQLVQGLGDSLAGRFEIIRAHHWNFAESKAGFGLNFDEYLQFGGYPGAYSLKKNQKRMKTYLLDSIFEAVVTKDILRFANVKKPALFRQTFALACQFPAQEVSYNKLLGQLQDAGNVDQVKYYLDLFSQAFLLRLLFKWGKSTLSRTSSPKILPGAPVFSSIFSRHEQRAEENGRLFEAMVGNRLCEAFDSVHYWREGEHEVDYIIEDGKNLFAVEVKSKARSTTGLEVFRKKNPTAQACYVDFSNYAQFEKDPKAFLEELSL